MKLLAVPQFAAEGDPKLQSMRREVDEAIEYLHAQVATENAEASLNKCRTVAERLTRVIDLKLADGVYTCAQELRQDWEDTRKTYLSETPKGASQLNIFVTCIVSRMGETGECYWQAEMANSKQEWSAKQMQLEQQLRDAEARLNAIATARVRHRGVGLRHRVRGGAAVAEPQPRGLSRSKCGTSKR